VTLVLVDLFHPSNRLKTERNFGMGRLFKKSMTVKWGGRMEAEDGILLEVQCRVDGFSGSNPRFKGNYLDVEK